MLSAIALFKEYGDAAHRSPGTKSFLLNTSAPRAFHRALETALLKAPASSKRCLELAEVRPVSAKWRVLGTISPAVGVGSEHCEAPLESPRTVG